MTRKSRHNALTFGQCELCLFKVVSWFIYHIKLDNDGHCLLADNASLIYVMFLCMRRTPPRVTSLISNLSMCVCLKNTVTSNTSEHGSH